ncbi:MULTISPECIES: acyl carrier protein [unclassified Nocardiopsis]|uniref:acyl carrier protein n=1 Tax=Nocardiopsis TaxID=2013 RepID=UPI00387B7C1F
METTHADVVELLVEHLRDNLKEEEQARNLTGSSPLPQWGALDSLNMVRLIVFIRDRLGVELGQADLKADHFATLDSIAELVVSRRAG